jgi:pantothenate kinase
VEPCVPLVITEGNYLLLEVAHWAGVREQLDEVWFVDADDELRRDRLVQRHIRFGRTPQAAREWGAYRRTQCQAGCGKQAAGGCSIPLGQRLTSRPLSVARCAWACRRHGANR